ncbi:MAG: DUF3108 domain-containing protein [Prolixibacteraceae bacterium]|nr:DUF3108 domain-containing protein [Prolixibacteraceae bacterium]
MKKRQESSQLIKVLLTFLLFSAFIFPEVATGQSIEYPFKSGEYARYGAYYNWNFIWLQSGEVEFKADTIQYKKQKAWHLKAVGKTFKTYDLLYSVRDTFEVFSNYDTFKPLYSRRVLNHAKSNSVHQYSFDYETGKIETRIRQEDKPLYTGRIPVQENTYDLLATAYHFRKFDFDKLFVGQKVPYRMLIDRQVADLYFRYLGKENVKTRNGKEYRCHKVSVYLLQGDFFPEGEYMKVWFTDDKNHLPVQVESEIQVGSVKALLLDSKSLKYPLSSLKK